MMTDAELTILSLVAEGARHGHEIQQAIDDRGLREWMTIGFSSVYYILNKLERQNMVTSRLHPDMRGPARKVYEITEAGRGILQTAVSNLLGQPRSLGSGFELGLINLHVLKPKQVYVVLRQHRDDLRRQLEAIERSWERHQSEDSPETAEHIRALYTHSLATMRADLAWIEQFVEDWRQRYPGVDETLPKPVVDDAHRAPTALHKRTSPDPAKMLQKLKRPPRASESKD